MFDQDNQQAASLPVQDPGVVTPTFDNNSVAVPEPTASEPSNGDQAVSDYMQKSGSYPPTQSAPPVRDDDTTIDDIDALIPAPVVTPLDTTTTTEYSESASPLAAPANGTTDDLQALKQKALASLTPIVGQLDQTPEEKFRTTMMMIQANDNKDLLPEAYAAAQSITDEKAKAQALLDVINEINYFSQPES